MPRFNLEDVRKALRDLDHRVAGDGKGEFSRFSTLENADADSLIWISPTHSDPRALISSTPASVILCADDYNSKPESLATKRLIITPQPRLAVARVGRALFMPPVKWGIHPTAVIDPEAKITEPVSIGPYAVIGKCLISANCIIAAHAQLLDGVKLGKHVTIGPGTAIGTPGFGFEHGADGKHERMAHIGGVSIGDEVEIGANTCIDRGTLNDTVIASGAKIDDLVHIAHNVNLGEDNLVIAHAQICGSVRTGKRCWIAPHAVIRDRLQIGDDAIIGIGAVVVRDVPAGAKMVGNPARNMNAKD